METKKCSFCGDIIELGTGKMYVKKDGSIFYFCSSKCQNNQKLGRAPRKARWTEQAQNVKKGIRL